MTDYTSRLNNIKNFIKSKDFSQIEPLLDSPVWQYEFYDTLIAEDESWFDILQDKGIFNFSDFPDKIEENGKTIQLVWGPFYYLNKIFSKIPDRVMPIFIEITKKHI